MEVNARPRVGVAIVTYNSAAVLGDCLDRLVQTRGEIDLDIVVADNDSADESVGLAESVPGVRVVSLGRNAGYAAGVNAAVLALDVDCVDAVLVLNPDIRLEADCLPRLLADLERPGMGIAVPRLLNSDRSLQVSIRRDPSVTRAWAEAVLGGARAGRTRRLGELITDLTEYEVSQQVSWATGAALLVSARTVATLGPWDESLLLYGEEVEYSLRAGDHGLGTWYDAQAVAVHVGGELESVPFLYALMTVNRVRVYRRWRGRGRGAAFHLAVTFGETLRAARGRSVSRLALQWLLCPSRRPAALPQRGDPSSGPVRIRSVGFDELTSADLKRWAVLQAGNPDLDSPYFDPAFTAAVARTQSGVCVVVATTADGEIESFLPLRVTGRSATAAGYPAADFQGPICAPGTRVDVRASLRACGVTALRFDHLRDGAEGFEPWVTRSESSPMLDITGGEVGYLSRASKTGRDNLAQARRRARKAEREIGPLRFVADSRESELLEEVIELKRGQYRVTGARDYFADGDHRRLLHDLLGQESEQFSGSLSALYAGPHLLAAHFGMRRADVLHWWFPVYAAEYSRLAPGWLLLRALIEAGPTLGVNRIDLGRGEDEYKRRAMTGHQTVHEAQIYLSPLRQRWELAREQGRGRLVASRLGTPMREIVHRARRLRSDT